MSAIKQQIAKHFTAGCRGGRGKEKESYTVHTINVEAARGDRKKEKREMRRKKKGK